MAITIRRQPNTLNQVNADLVYVASSTKTGEPQMKYVCDIQDKDRNLLVRLKQEQNPSGYAVFEVGSILQDYMEFDKPFEENTLIYNAVSQSQRFHVAFGEEYGTSTSSSTDIYNGKTDAVGTPAKSGSSLFLGMGIVDYTLGNTDGYNYDSSSKWIPYAFDEDVPDFNNHQALTDSPLTQSIADSDYHTITLYQVSPNDDRDNIQSGSDPYYVQFTGYTQKDGKGSQVGSWDYYNIRSNGGGPRTGTTDKIADVTSSIHFTDGTLWQTFAIGGGNYPNISNIATASLSYKVQVLKQGTDGQENSNQVLESRIFNVINTASCGYEPVRFAFVNDYGAWDYHTFSLAQSRTDAITRKTYDQNIVDYSTNNTFAPFDGERRGTTVYDLSVQESRTVESDYLTQEEADWLRQLLESPEVFIQRGTQMIPVVITNSSYSYKLNPRSQKLYTLSIQFKIARKRRSR